MFKLVSSFIFLLMLGGCYPSYSDLMSAAYKAKRADPNPNPIFAGEEEPPIPDEDENNKTLLGIDKNQNGIRDDVDIWINRTGKNYNEIMALRQKARGNQAFLKAVNDNRSEIAEKTMNQALWGDGCIRVIFPSNDRRELSLKLINQANTIIFEPEFREEKAQTFYKYILNYGGGPDGGIKKDYKYCDFKIEEFDSVIKKYFDSLQINAVKK
jgi:hypothetical protein